MTKPHYEFIIRYHDLSSEQVQDAISDAFHRVDLILEKRSSGNLGLFIPTVKLLTINHFLSNVAIAVDNTKDVTEMIRDQLLSQSSHITLIKDIREIFIP